MVHGPKKRPKQGKTRGKRPSWSVASRAADEPFCAYFGAQGETCAETTNLAEVFVIAGPPKLVWLACSQHCEDVGRLAQAFVQRSQNAPQTLLFQYHGHLSQIQVTWASNPKKGKAQ